MGAFVGGFAEAVAGFAGGIGILLGQEVGFSRLEIGEKLFGGERVCGGGFSIGFDGAKGSKDGGEAVKFSGVF